MKRRGVIDRETGYATPEFNCSAPKWLTIRSPADQIIGSLAQERLTAMLSGFFGVLALLPAGIGLHGVTA
jgi:hypothetical protein